MTHRNITARNNTYSSCFISLTCKFASQWYSQVKMKYAPGVRFIGKSRDS